MKKQELAPHWKALADLAVAARERSYSPYSKFKVGCALEDDQGRLFTGCNVENANYSESLCAERTAIVKMVSEGGSRVIRVAVVTSSEEPCFPCGSCLQVLQEFGLPKVLSFDVHEKEYKEVALEALLPYRFNGDQLLEK